MKALPIAMLATQVLIVCVLAVAMYTRWHIDHGVQIGPTYQGQTLRDEFAAINELTGELLGQSAKIVNIGTAPNTATGDPLPVAVWKVEENLRQLRDQKYAQRQMRDDMQRAHRGLPSDVFKWDIGP